MTNDKKEIQKRIDKITVTIAAKKTIIKKRSKTEKKEKGKNNSMKLN